MAKTIDSTNTRQQVISLEDRRQFRLREQERESFFGWLDDVATSNAAQNADMSELDVLALIELARMEAMESN